MFQCILHHHAKEAVHRYYKGVEVATLLEANLQENGFGIFKVLHTHIKILKTKLEELKHTFFMRISPNLIFLSWIRRTLILFVRNHGLCQNRVYNNFYEFLEKKIDRNRFQKRSKKGLSRP